MAPSGPELWHQRSSSKHAAARSSSSRFQPVRAPPQPSTLNPSAAQPSTCGSLFLYCLNKKRARGLATSRERAGGRKKDTIRTSPRFPTGPASRPFMPGRASPRVYVSECAHECKCERVSVRIRPCAGRVSPVMTHRRKIRLWNGSRRTARLAATAVSKGVWLGRLVGQAQSRAGGE